MFIVLRFFISHKSGQGLYESRFLKTARVTMDKGDFYCKAEVKPEMRKQGHYIVDINLSSMGDVRGAHCDCGAGSGDTAHCKHVVCCLFGIDDLVNNKRILLSSVCTQELQTFHHPTQPYFGTPMKCDSLPGKNVKRLQSVNFQPLKANSLNASKYQTKVRNLVLNYSAVHSDSRIPLKHTYIPANPYAIVWDHCYPSVTLQEQVLNHFKHLSISDEEIAEIERLTRGQAENDYWFVIRRVHMSASKFGEICCAVSDEAKKNIVDRLLNPRPASGAAIEHGKTYEPRAIQKYEEMKFVKTKQCGTFISKSHPYLSASPDALIIGNENIVFEAKCPFSAKDQKINEHTVPYLCRDMNGNLCMKKDDPYYYQVQGEMMVTGKTVAHFGVWTFKDFQVFCVPYDSDFINKMQCQLEEFYAKFYKPALLEKYLYKNYGKVFCKK